MITTVGNEEEPTSKRRVVALMLETHFTKAMKRHNRLVSSTIIKLLLASLSSWLIVYLWGLTQPLGC